MTPERYQRIKSIFFEAADSRADVRQAVLDRACGSDMALREEVEKLLVAQEPQTSDIHGVIASADLASVERAIENIQVEVASSAVHSVERGDVQSMPSQIAGYQLERVIGSGGMGTVYAARQRNPARTVALKVMRAAVATRTALRRFEFEAQVLAHLRYSGIAQIYEAGTFQLHGVELPYFVMEYVADAVSLTEFVKRNALSVRKKLEMFCHICDAIQYGHQKGIIHRDIKPNNILVDAAGVPKIIDFGVARAIDSDLAVTTMQTNAGQLVGTLQYMSPEQASADSNDIDVRSDVYALGVVLFQLATGGLPYDLHGVSILEATSIVQERRPPKLERFSPALSKGERRELDTIIERAMAKQRDHRYSGVAELSADIRRFLNHEPIEARPLGRVYRLRKLTRKHRGIVIASSFAVLALIAGSVVSTIEAIRAMRMQRKAETKERLAVGVNDFYRDQILGRANPNRTMKSGPNTTLGEAVDLAALEVSTSFPDDPLLQAAVHESLGEAYAGMGRQSDAQREFQQALEVYKSQLGMEAPETSEVSFHLATSYRLDGKLAEAEPLYQIVLNIRERTLGPDAAETCVAMVGLATMYHDLSRWNAAIGLLEPAVGGMTNVLGGSDIDTIQARMYLASCYLATGKPEQAENLFRDSLTRLRATVGDEHPDTTNCMSSLGMLLSRAGKHDDALALIREAADINRRTLGADHPDSLSSLELEALALESKGDLNAALQIHEEGVELCRSSTLLTRGDYANTLSKLAGCLTKLQRYQEAEEALLEAYPITVEAFGPDHYRTRRAVNNLVKLYRSTGRPVQSREWESRLPAAQ